MIAPKYHIQELVLGVKDLVVKYGDDLILDKLNLEIYNIVRDDVTTPTGQIEAILGPSGVGKTSLFNCLAGLQKPTSGEMTLYNGHAQTVTPKTVGVVMQHYPLLEHRTVLSNMMLAANSKDPTKKKAEHKEMSMNLLASFGIEDKANKYPAELSGGQKQRVAIAQQLICSGSFLLLDEPFSGLDVIAKDKVVSVLKNIVNQNEFNTILIITHDIEAAISVADTIHIINKNKDAPGANIKKTYNLADEGLAWIDNPRTRSEFYELARTIYTDFVSL